MGNEFKNRWDKFRDALRHEDQLVWDQMWKAIDFHQDAIESMDGNEFEKQFVAMMIEKRKSDNEFEAELDSLNRRLAALEKNLRQND
jgi:hypothetical protein